MAGPSQTWIDEALATDMSFRAALCDVVCGLQCTEGVFGRTVLPHARIVGSGNRVSSPLALSCGSCFRLRNVLSTVSAQDSLPLVARRKIAALFPASLI